MRDMEYARLGTGALSREKLPLTISDSCRNLAIYIAMKTRHERARMQIALYEAKNKLSGLVDTVVKGGEVTIMRRGKAVARLMPVEGGFDRAKAKQAAKMLLELRKGNRLDGLSVKELRDEGRP